MMKEHDRQEHLKTLDENERKKEEEHYEEMRKKHADHPKVNHPVSLIEAYTRTTRMCFVPANEEEPFLSCFIFLVLCLCTGMGYLNVSTSNLILLACCRVARIN